MAVPADAPHPRNAQLFLNFLLRPEIAAKNTNMTRYATAVAPSYPLVDPVVYNNHNIYPTPEMLGHYIRSWHIPWRSRGS